MLVARYSAVAHRTAVLLGAGEDAEDAVQEAFVKAYRHLRGFRPGAPFRPWLLRIVANETKNLQRSRGRQVGLVSRVWASLPADAHVSDADPEGTAVAGEWRGQLLAAVRLLPDREREAVVCRYFLELSEAETAQVLGWPRGSVKSRTFRALARLRAGLDRATVPYGGGGPR